MATTTKYRGVYSTPLDKLAAGRHWVRHKWAYYLSSVTSLVPRQVPGLGTLGVSERGVLIYDPEVIMPWEVQHLGTALTHEALHLLRHHAARARRLLCLPAETILRPDRLDSQTVATLKLWNVAADCEINDDLIAAGGEFPFEVCAPEKFGLRPGLTAEEYYHLLAQQAASERKQARSGRPDKPEGSGKAKGSGRDQGDPGANGGQAKDAKDAKDAKGQGAGDEVGDTGDGDDDDADGDTKGAGNEGGGSLSSIKPGPGAGRCGSCAGLALPEEEAFEGIGRTPAEHRRIERQVAEAVRQAAQRGRGDMPGGWARWADATFETPKIPWQQKLALVVRAAVGRRMGAVSHTHSRLSRRQAGIGYGAGLPMLPALSAPQVKVAVVVDTSGSMGTDELKAAIAETSGVLRAAGGTIDLCACDAKVHELQPVRDAKQAAAMLKGGGGTDFRPAFNALMDRPRGARPDVVVFMTDGQGPAPASPPACKVIWCLIGRYRTRPCEWGDVVEID